MPSGRPAAPWPPIKGNLFWAFAYDIAATSRLRPAVFQISP
jgi:hypothetical protein